MMSEAFLDLPALAPPPGVTPNFIDPPNLRQPWLAVVQITLATLAVFMRLFTKKFVVKRVLIDDCESIVVPASIMLVLLHRSY